MKEDRKGVEKAIRDFIDTMRLLKRILSWVETWIPTLIAFVIVAWWFIFGFALSLPNPWRAIIIWGGLVFGTPATVLLIILIRMKLLGEEV